MAKTVKFPLEMDNGAEVRSMEELREHFSLVHVLRYVESGKLSKWLRARYEDEIADKIDSLDPDDQELAKKVSEIFGVPYDEKAEEELDEAVERVARLDKLKQFEAADADIRSKKEIVQKSQLIGMASGCMNRIDGVLLKRNPTAACQDDQRERTNV